MKLAENQKAWLKSLGRGPDADIDLTEAVLSIAAMERPGVALEPYRRHLGRLVKDVGGYAKNAPGGTAGRADGQGLGSGLGLKAEALREVIVKRYGYRGSEEAFDDRHGENLMQVIDRRRGLPVMLGILYMHAARGLGWTITGIDFPGQFLVRLEDCGERMIIDSFGGGRELTPRDLREICKAVAGNEAELTPDHYRSMANRDIVLRVLNNIKVSLLKAERLEDALEYIEAMLLFAPDVSYLWREAGLLHARLDNIKAAVAALEEFLRRESDGGSGGDSGNSRASALLQELRGRLG